VEINCSRCACGWLYIVIMITKIFIRTYLRLYAKRKVTGERNVGRRNCCVTAVLLLCYCCVTAVLLVCYCCVTAVLLLCYCCVTGVLLRCYWCFTAVLLLCYWCVTGVLLLCYCCVTGVLLLCYWCVTAVLLLCYGCAIILEIRKWQNGVINRSKCIAVRRVCVCVCGGDEGVEGMD